MSSLFAFPAELRRGHEDLLRLAQTVAQHGVTSAMVELTSEAGVSADGCERGVGMSVARMRELFGVWGGCVQ